MSLARFSASLLVAAREPDQKFVAAVAADIPAAHRILQPLSDRFQDLIADEMTILIIDVLKIIDVHQHNSHRGLDRHAPRVGPGGR